MATQKQIEANRANAQKSTGPRTPEGKKAASMSAIMHGLTSCMTVLPHEDPEKYDDLVTQFMEAIKPKNHYELFLVKRLTHAAWRLLRAMQYETDIVSHQIRDLRGHDRVQRLCTFFSNDDYTKLTRYESAVERSFYRAIQAIQRQRKPAKRARSKPPSADPASEIYAVLSAVEEIKKHTQNYETNPIPSPLNQEESTNNEIPQKEANPI